MIGSFLISALLLGSVADASVPVCIAIDKSGDQLSEQERETAQGLLHQSVALWGGTLAPEGCEDPWLLSHVKVGDKLSVSLRRARTAHLRRAANFELLPETYLELLKACEVMPTPPPSAPTEPVANQTVTKQSPVPESTTPTRRSWFGPGRAHGHFYARIGYNGTLRNDLNLGPSLGLGYRLEIGQLLFDVSTVNLNLWRETPYQDYKSTWNAYLRLMAFRYLDDYLGLNFYAGGGLSYGRTDTHDGFTADGLQAEVGIGYEILRKSWVRTFVQIVASIPTYQVYASDYYYPGIYQPDYAWSVASSVGLGF
jgi:hypothetical protein